MDGRCTRCAGCLGTAYDEIERVRVVYCLNCGHRPHQAIRRADGLALDAPLLCVRGCGRPAGKKWNVLTKCEEYTRHCVECRVKYATKKRLQKRAQRRAAAACS